MFIYIITIFFSTTTIAYATNINNNHKKKILLFLSFFVLCIVSATRVDVGTDFGPYFSGYLDYSFLRWEPGFVLLCQLCHLTSSSIYILFITSSIIIYGLIFLTIVKRSITPAQTLYLFFVMLFYFAFMNIIRQALAVSIVVFALLYLREKNIFLCFLFLILACLFHYSAILVFVLSPIIVKRHSQIFYLILLSSIPLLFIGSEAIIPLLSKTQYGVYLDDTISNNYIQILIEFIICIICFANFKKINSMSSIGYILINMEFFNLMTYSLSGLPYVQRVAVYFKIGQIFLFPILFALIGQKKTRTVISFVFLLLLSILAFYFTINGVNEVIPYKSFLF